jgi:hypothetical protein
VATVDLRVLSADQRRRNDIEGRRRDEGGALGRRGGLGQPTSYSFHFLFSSTFTGYCSKLLFKVFLKLLRHHHASRVSRLSIRQ